MLLYQIVADLMPFVAAFYLLECLSWARPPAVLFAEGVGGGFRRRGAGLQPGPVLPWRRAYSAVDLPYLLDAKGLWIPRARNLVPGRFFERGNFRRLRWDELEEVRIDHRRLELNGTTIHFPSPAQATAHALRLETLRRLKGNMRTAKVEEESARALRLGTASELEGKLRKLRRPLDLVCSVLFLTVFVAVPASVAVGPLSPALPWLLVLALVQVAFVGWMVIRTARRLEGAGLRTDGLLLPLLLSPPSLIRASIELTEHLLQGTEAVTVGVLLLERDAALAALRRQHHASRYAAGAGCDGGTGDEEEADAVEWIESWSGRTRLLERLATQAEIDVEEMLQPPAMEEGAGAYCPHCDGTFATEQVCPTCALPTLVAEPSIAG